VLRRLGGLWAGLVLLAIILGCMSGHTEWIHDEDGAFAQSGSVSIPANHEQDVYYPVPYHSPPNLTLEDTWNGCVVRGQWPDHFRVKNSGLFSSELTWKARGIKAFERAVLVPVPEITKTSNPPPVFPTNEGTVQK
jgi:hypothetical protein